MPNFVSRKKKKMIREIVKISVIGIKGEVLSEEWAI